MRASFATAVAVALIVAACRKERPATSSAKSSAIERPAPAVSDARAAAPPTAAPTTAASTRDDAATPSRVPSNAEAGDNAVKEGSKGGVTAAGVFAHAKRIRDDNAGDVNSATREGLLAAVAEFKKAVDLGYSTPAEAFHEIGVAYRSISLSFRHGLSAEQIEGYRELARTFFRRAVENDPTDSESRIDLAMTLRGTESRELLEEVVRRDPRNARGQYLLGFELLREGDGRAAADQFIRTASLFDADDVQRYARDAAMELRRKGYAREAERLEKHIREPSE